VELALKGAEPIPGYRLLEPIGKGGFGEVWRCEAPGGLYKAIKFVPNSAEAGTAATQELEALQRVKSLRHPFILSLDRIEVQDDWLLIITELADQNLYNLHCAYRDRGLAGIPREELLALLLEAAEALDWMNFEHGLQHLDVKPQNLFVVSGHVKVADFGLVHRLDDDHGAALRQGGVTPLYASPELFRGAITRHSDQYSLAIVYQQLLTGTLPFWHEKLNELMMQHLSTEPALSALPVTDRSVVARALAKAPEERFGSCLEFLQALIGEQASAHHLRLSGIWRRILPTGRGERSAGGSTPRRTSTGSIPTVKGLPPRQGGREGTRDSGAPCGPGQTDGGSGTSEEGPSNPITPSLRLSMTPRPAPQVPDTPSPSPQSTSGEPLLPPTSVSLPGFRFCQCLSQGPLGDLWRAEDSAGRSCRALCLLSFVRYDEGLIAHLRALRHPALPPGEVHWSSAERLVLLTPWFDQTLRDHFDRSRAAGLPGVPRADLLRYLRMVAEALDTMRAEHVLQHLGLNPRNLLVDGERLWIADFGVIPLAWLPTGEPAAALNSRYAAPELFDGGPAPSSDQYSLALIYAEMLAGVHPSRLRTGLPGRGSSGKHRRLGARSLTPPRPPDRAPASRQAPASRLDLDLLPVADRAVLTRALHPEPAQRWPSCLALVEALEAAGVAPAQRQELYATLPPVIPLGTLFGESTGPGVLLPSVATLVQALTPEAPDPRTVEGAQNSRYLVHADGPWEYRCPLKVLPGALRLKAEGFRQQWQARVARQDGESYLFHIDLPVARRLWERVLGQQKYLEVELRVAPVAPATHRLTEAVVRVRVVGLAERDQAERALATLAPQVFDSMRQYLQPSPEQRSGGRLPCLLPLRVYPVLPDLELAEPIEGACKDISRGGICFRVPQVPPTDRLYLHLHTAPVSAPYAILAQVMRWQEAGGSFEVGAAFTGP
jgi:serine/threonine protein kinase